MSQIVLGSASPRRQELLGRIFSEFEVIPADCDETIPVGTDSQTAVLMLAKRKALAVFEANRNKTIIGADTIVARNGKLLGKPQDQEEAKRMLRALSGQVHQVATGVCLCNESFCECFVSVTDVCFYSLTEAEIEGYVASGEAMDKAGAYGIQGQGALLIREIRGDYYNVMGLPIAQLARVCVEKGLLKKSIF